MIFFVKCARGFAGEGEVKGGKEEEEGRREGGGRAKPAAGEKIGFLMPFRASWSNGSPENGFPASRSIGG